MAQLSPIQHSSPSERPLISVIAPIYNEAENINPLYARLRTVLEDLKKPYEILFIDDGSLDQSAQLIRKILDTSPSVGLLRFSRNFGHESATSCGLHHAKGQTVVIIDADLQDPPELIPEMIELWRQGYELVYAKRRTRKSESILVRTTSTLFYRIFNFLVRGNMPTDTGDFRLMDRKVVDAFNEFGERNRYVRGLTYWAGFRQKAILYDREARFKGQTSYNFSRRLRLALDAIFSMSTVPLRVITLCGLFVTLASMAKGTHVLLQKLMFHSPTEGYTLQTMGIFFLGGVQLLTLGVIGEYVGRIYAEVQKRPPLSASRTRVTQKSFQKKKAKLFITIL